jgi:hypothetical protein
MKKRSQQINRDEKAVGCLEKPYLPDIGAFAWNNYEQFDH